MAAKRVSGCLLLVWLCALREVRTKSVADQGAVGKLGMGVVACLGEAAADVADLIREQILRRGDCGPSHLREKKGPRKARERQESTAVRVLMLCFVKDVM